MYNNYYVKLIAIIVTLFIILPFVALAQVTEVSTSTNSTSVPLEIPENFAQSKNFIIPLLKKVPGVSWNIFREQVLPRWKQLFSKWSDLWSHFWYSYLKPKIQILINKIARDLNLKIKEKEPQIRENFQKQKEILGKDIEKQLPGVKKTIWQRIKELLH